MMLRICISQSPNSCSKQQLNTQYQHGYTVPGSYQVPYGCVNLVVAAPWILVHEKSRMESVPHDVRMPAGRRKELFTPEGDHYTELIRQLNEYDTGHSKTTGLYSSCDTVERDGTYSARLLTH